MLFLLVSILFLIRMLPMVKKLDRHSAEYVPTINYGTNDMTTLLTQYKKHDEHRYVQTKNVSICTDSMILSGGLNDHARCSRYA